MSTSIPRRGAAAAFAAAILAAACGGAGDEPPAPSPEPAAASARISRVVVAGDSLADVGTFGFRATVQDAPDRDGYPVYPEIVARELGAGRPCNFFSSDDGESFSENAGCTGFAVGGAMVRNPVTRGGSRVPFSLEHQLETAVEAQGGSWRAGDLLVIDAGANDAAALADAWLDAQAGGSAEEAVFLALLRQELDASTIEDALDQPGGESVAARLYMQQLARTYWNTVKANTLDRGATRVALLDIPDITRTPRLRATIAGLEASQGTGAGSAFESALRQWITAFNDELARLVAGEDRVALVPYFEEMVAHVAQPASFGLDNVTEPSCPPASGFPDCTDAALDAAPPQPGLGRGWWQRWYWSDGFHPSPRGHQLLAQAVERAVARAGWR